jgi:two-component system, chemotaxis family, CheB/CheR fusion protein
MNNRARERILERFAPAFAVVTAEGNGLQYSKRVRRYLELVVGASTQNILLTARPELRVSLRVALKQVVETDRPVEKSAIPIVIAGEGIRRVSIVVEPWNEQASAPLYLVVFNEITPLKTDSREDTTTGTNDVPSEFNLQAEAECREPCGELQSISKEQGNLLEDVRSTNGNLDSLNEEQRPADEELETSQEEIQAMNVELQTVNAQLAGKLRELDQRSTDLAHLFESTQVAAVFLDPRLIIHNFTGTITDLYNVIPSDKGRPLTDVMSRLKHFELRKDVMHVLDTRQPLERRVARGDDSAHYLMRILPHCAPSSVIDGVIVTFVDVTSIVRAEQRQRLLVSELNHRVKNILTVVISLATQTVRRSENLDEFSRNYIDRIRALAAAYCLPSDHAWQAVDLHELVMEELRPFVENQDGAELDGPKIALEPHAARALSIAIHELTTNAVKYGALSVPSGSVSVKWQVEHGAAEPQLLLEWAENNGPRVSPPKRRGFGLDLIERGLKQDMSATINVEFAVEGVRATVRAPLSASLAVTSDNS